MRLAQRLAHHGSAPWSRGAEAPPGEARPRHDGEPAPVLAEGAAPREPLERLRIRPPSFGERLLGTSVAPRVSEPPPPRVEAGAPRGAPVPVRATSPGERAVRGPSEPARAASPGERAIRGPSEPARAASGRRPVPRVAQGFRREGMELPVARGRGRPAALGRDLAAVELPTAPALARALGTLARLPAAGIDPHRPAVLLDLETTGLLGQAGALVCVVGVAWHVAPDRLRVEQWSLHRASAEAAMLADLDAALRERAGPRSPFVTFNGGSFDLPLLRRRLVRHGIYAPTEDVLRAPHVDLLPTARRLWRDRGPDCRLGTLERCVLRLAREGDVSGAEVVELLWRWLEAPDAATAEDLARVQRHNRIDVLSMAALAHAMHERLCTPADAVERLRAARHHARLDRLAHALELLAPLLERLGRGEGAGRGASPAVEAGLLAAELERRRGRVDEAARRWAQVCRFAPGDPIAHDALAKHLEHRARQPAAALAVASASDTPCERRLARLGNRVEEAAIPALADVLAGILGGARAPLGPSGGPS